MTDIGRGSFPVCVSDKAAKPMKDTSRGLSSNLLFMGKLGLVLFALLVGFAGATIIAVRFHAPHALINILAYGYPITWFIVGGLMTSRRGRTGK